MDRGHDSGSDIGGEIGELFEQHAASRQHAFDFVGRISDRLRTGIQHKLGIQRWLVAAVGSSKTLQLAGTCFAVMTLWITRLADVRRGGNMDLVEEFIGDAARLGAVVQRR